MVNALEKAPTNALVRNKMSRASPPHREHCGRRGRMEPEKRGSRRDAHTELWHDSHSCLHKTESINVLAWSREALLGSPPFCDDLYALMVDGREHFSGIAIW